MMGEEAKWAGLGPEDCADRDEPRRTINLPIMLCDKHGLQPGSACQLCAEPQQTDVTREAEQLSDLLCHVHNDMDKEGMLQPFDNCVACIRSERDELREALAVAQRQWKMYANYHTFTGAKGVENQDCLEGQLWRKGQMLLEGVTPLECMPLKHGDVA